MSKRLNDELHRSNNDKILRNELLTVQEVADYYRVSRATVWRWCRQGVIPAFRAGRNWRIHRDGLLELDDIPPANGIDHEEPY